MLLLLNPRCLERTACRCRGGTKLKRVKGSSTRTIFRLINPVPKKGLVLATLSFRAFATMLGRQKASNFPTNLRHASSTFDKSVNTVQKMNNKDCFGHIFVFSSVIAQNKRALVSKMIQLTYFLLTCCCRGVRYVMSRLWRQRAKCLAATSTICAMPYSRGVSPPEGRGAQRLCRGGGRGGRGGS